MAQPITEIYNALIAEKNLNTALNGLQPNIDSSQTLLNDLTSASKVAVWRLILFIVAVGLWTQQKLWDVFKVELQAIVNTAVPGTARWYQGQAFLFQLGYALTWLNNKYQYTDTTSPAAIASQIVKRAAAVEVPGELKIKVAKLVAGVVTKLTAAELVSFDAYMQQINFAGVNLSTESFDPDILHLKYTCYYDPLVISPDGSLISDPAVFPAEDAVNGFISDLPFNGRFRLVKLTDAVEAAQGINDPELTLAESKYGANPYVPIVVEFTPNAGYLVIDDALPMRTEFTYIADV